MSVPQPPVAEIEALGAKLGEAKASIAKRIIGQEQVVELSLAAMLSGGHALLMGLPGLGKTLLVDTLSTVMGLSANRVQFTPDLMPADILGSEVLETAADGARSFRFLEGPIFCQLLMADEINRASPRTQSRCCRRCRNVRLPLRANTALCLHLFTSWRRKTRLNRKAPIHCRKRSLTGFL